MAPYFETAKSFADVPITPDGVDTATFLLASTDFVNMFDLLGGGVFAFVQNDLRSNITGVRHRYDVAPSESPTLEKLVTNECAVADSNRHGTACLVRLLRGLWFTCEALRNMQQDRDAELHTCFKRSYDANLKHHHSFVVRSVVSVCRSLPPWHNRRWALIQLTLYVLDAAMGTRPALADVRRCQVAIRAVPHRRDFYARITQGGSHEKFDNELTKWLAGLEVIVLRLKAFLEEGSYGRV
ncbi:glycolipid transfer protein [Trametes coccinea BRFM310]|uniref:Glycolipid transfer protein n=1 Tax=Trametes coccinea (strain BRFM310) TaxID=1353009 RepID=A0A1Y2IWD2_TRAC3|nr:glycolipid transfer protein [Trametes coccinea BRFM310]